MPCIYKLTNNLGDVYYGSTTQNPNRQLQIYKSLYSGWLNGTDGRFRSVFQIIHHPSCKITMLDEFPKGTTKKEIMRVLSNHINNNPCCNYEPSLYYGLLKKIDNTHRGLPKHNEFPLRPAKEIPTEPTNLPFVFV